MKEIFLYHSLQPFLDHSPFLQRFDQCIKEKENGTLFYQLNSTTKCLLAVRVFFLLQEKKNVLLVTSEDNKGEEYYDDLCLIAGKDKVVFIPDLEILPYEERSPHLSIRAQRIRELTKLLDNKPRIVIVSLKNLLRFIVPPVLLKKNILTIETGTDYDLDFLCSKLVSIGYKAESEVIQVGDFSRRGGILDLFSPSEQLPVRLDFFGDTLESCRFFNPQSQRSTGERIEKFRLLPVREVFLDEITSTDPFIWETIHNTGLYEGIEQDISLLYDESATICDYIGLENTITLIDEMLLLKNATAEFREETHALYRKKIPDGSRPTVSKGLKAEFKKQKRYIPKPEELFESFVFLMKRVKQNSYFLLSSYYSRESVSESEDNALMSTFTSQTGMNGELNILRKILDAKLKDDWHIIIQSDNLSQSRRMKELLIEYEERVEFLLGVFHYGFDLEDSKLAVFTDHEIFNRYKQKKYQEYYSSGESLTDYETLRPGDYIVHVDHGIGIYEGLKLMKVNGVNIECLAIRYAENAKVYVPTFQLRLVTRFVADEGVKPEINKLGSKKWETVKNRAKKQIELIADDLVRLYAERTTRTGIGFEVDNVWQQDLEDSFIYEDTPDQKRAAEEIKRDMEQIKPMERLLCGDVGFGKTEVAVRAAFKAVTSGWQVAVLVPTTLLAEQHYLVFRERLAQYPINIAMLSRFRTTKHLKDDVARIAAGEVDIAIGTHRLLSNDVKFKRLGLLIIDEEHRFGVRHKETLRKLKVNVDTLYMSATPIPRTLSMALSRFKDMSLMQTSPKARLPIRTVVISYDKEIIKDAVLREMERGGQIIFLHNRVETIDSIAADLRELLPKAKIAVGHGQLPERLLERIMLDFYDKKYDILAATTIIESGIDIPNANTIIINRADMFGLAQLYQLRGRVGRSNRRAYAYFVIPKHLKEQARKRLEALTEYNALGSGYQIAMRDLELRGAGTMLGVKQSGVIQTIGFNYYNRLLSEAVESLTSNNNKTDNGDIHQTGENKSPERKIQWEDEKEKYKERLRIDADFFFPGDYIEDEKSRLDFYQRMLDFTEIREFISLEEELRDRFGEIPDPARRGLRYYRLRLLAKKGKLESFQLRNNKIVVEFSQGNMPSEKVLQRIIGKIDFPVNFDATGKKLKMTISLPDTIKKSDDTAYGNTFDQAERLLQQLGERD
jgi:transcription-repair coupling factor (superfamily II helicase)